MFEILSYKQNAIQTTKLLTADWISLKMQTEDDNRETRQTKTEKINQKLVLVKQSIRFVVVLLSLFSSF